ncbi:MAG: hypothetical protein ACYTF6_15125, partial [Planctomycetota bacterium]
IRESGAKTMLFMTWARKHEPQQQASITSAYKAIGCELGVAVAPVGAAWQNALVGPLNLDFHHDDKSHPKPAGTYLAACVFYAALTGQSPEGLPARVAVEDTRNPDNEIVLADLGEVLAAFLQRIARQTVKDFKAPAAEPAARAEE